MSDIGVEGNIILKMLLKRPCCEDVVCIWLSEAKAFLWMQLSRILWICWQYERRKTEKLIVIQLAKKVSLPLDWFITSLTPQPRHPISLKQFEIYLWVTPNDHFPRGFNVYRTHFSACHVYPLLSCVFICLKWISSALCARSQLRNS
jgi:hypothetical protein